MGGLIEIAGTEVSLIDVVAVAWFVLAGLSTAYVVWDSFVKKNPEATVMKWGWILITLYMGPIALALYVLTDKEPAPGEHEEFIKPLWKQGIGSTVHCIAGDATGIITAAVVTAALGLPMWVDLIVEYAAGFAFGRFIFQSLFMKDMAGGSYLKAVKNSFMPEWLSMNMMAAGMFPVRIFLMMGRDMRAMEPTEPLFWAVMSLGVIVGFFVAYPVNAWMVSKNLKHGLMHVPATEELARTAEASPHDSVPAPHVAMSGTHAGHGLHQPKSAHHQRTQRGVRKVQEHKTEMTRENYSMQHDGHAGMHHHHEMKPNVTRPQLAVVTILTVLALVLGVVIPAQFVNLSLSAEDVGGAIMPPGMTMTRDTPAAAMREMAAVAPEEVSYTAPADARGDRALEPRIANDGTKVFDLTASVIAWNILPGERVQAYAFNRQVPGPRIRVTEGDRVRINVNNELPEATSVHWHGMVLPNEMDGPADVTQKPIEPGESFTYEFTARQQGTYFYHSHKEPDRQQALGMYGALIVDPKDPSIDESYDYDLEHTIQLQEWLEKEGYTYPAMLMEGAMPNFFTINGKSYPETETINMKVGERVRLRFIGSNNNFVHPMHVHGGPFKVVQADGNPVPEAAQIEKDTVNVGSGERYDVIWEAREPGKWLVHCHIPHHTTNDNVEEEGGGGLTMVMSVTE